jgi:sugar lactone lactonase YvrE
MKRSFRLILMSAAVLFCGTAPFAQMSAPEIPYDSAANLLKGFPADTYIGEAAGVATNSLGHIFVFTRSGNVAATLTTERTFVRGNGGARLFEFDATGTFVKEIGKGLYGFEFAHGVRVDPQDNIWAVDEGSNMILKFSKDGRMLMNFGRRPEAITVPGGPPATARGGGAGRGGGVPGAGVEGETFTRPTDVAWDSDGNVYIADGMGPNARVIKFEKGGKFVKSWGATGTGQGQFKAVTSIAIDKANNVYVADPGNKRIQVFDSNGTFKSEISNVGAPMAICVSPGAHQYLYSSNSNDPKEPFEGGEIYKMDLDGKVLGKFGKAGKMAKEFGTVSEIDCRGENTLLVGEIANWRVQKLTLHSAAAK